MNSRKEHAVADELANPALAELQFLIGDWDMALSDASFLPDHESVVHGRVEARAIEDGRLLAMRQVVEPSAPPAATWVIGRDESNEAYAVLYADGRGVSRVYEMTFSGWHWCLWRDDPHFSQRFDATVGEDRNRIVGEWQKGSSPAAWEHDFNVTYTRL
jgi:hypothetical protein